MWSRMSTRVRYRREHRTGHRIQSACTVAARRTWQRSVADARLSCSFFPTPSSPLPSRRPPAGATFPTPSARASIRRARLPTGRGALAAGAPQTLRAALPLRPPPQSCKKWSGVGPHAHAVVDRRSLAGEGWDWARLHNAIVNIPLNFLGKADVQSKGIVANVRAKPPVVGRGDIFNPLVALALIRRKHVE